MDYWEGKRVCWPPSQIIGGALLPWPPSSYAYVKLLVSEKYNWQWIHPSKLQKMEYISVRRGGGGGRAGMVG